MNKESRWIIAIGTVVVIATLLTGCEEEPYVPAPIQSSVVIHRTGAGIESAVIIFPHTSKGSYSDPDEMVVFNSEEIDTLIIQLDHIKEQLEMAQKSMLPAQLPEAMIDSNSESSHEPTEGG
tara:strand:+ start:3760 stop:4125 length:366 start_codon:yes stop_codon:yes gene_type:complete